MLQFQSLGTLAPRLPGMPSFFCPNTPLSAFRAALLGQLTVGVVGVAGVVGVVGAVWSVGVWVSLCELPRLERLDRASCQARYSPQQC